MGYKLGTQDADISTDDRSEDTNGNASTRGNSMRVLRMFGAALVLFAAFGGPALAGNIVLTGHDDDFHENFGAGPGPAGPAGVQLNAMVGFARAGSALPVLSLDHGSELNNALTALGIPFTPVDPNNAVALSAAMAGLSAFSAIVVASDFRCGGCDNDSTSSTNIASHSAEIRDFFNAGGGIVALAAATNADYYKFVPATASPSGSPPDTGYVQTADGAAFGIPAVNGNPTHNFFPEPGAGGVDPAYKVLERNTLIAGNPAETIGIKGGTIICTPGTPNCGFSPVPEPATIVLLGTGLSALVAVARLRPR